MLEISNWEVIGWEHVVRGMRNPLNSWSKNDSFVCTVNDEKCVDDCPLLSGGCTIKDDEDDKDYFIIGNNDLNLMNRLINAGPDHRKFMRMITVYLDITAPLYWWKEFDTYKVGTVANSCSTMHKIHEKKFTIDDFSHEYLYKKEDCFYGDMVPYDYLEMTISVLNNYRDKYNISKHKKDWWQMIQLLPSSYNQKRTVMLNYEVLSNMYKSRKNHKLVEWLTFCNWIENSLPYSELITRDKVAIYGKILSYELFTENFSNI